ncbi:MAG TPA: ankyrin repeat domain-containing protein [Candidatus Babeliales bacterium]|nr:ankyrin repeat domain-containing protein [Candidatus Babeliales bacterium]
MKQCLKKNFLVAIIINCGLSQHVYTANATARARKRAERITKQVQPSKPKSAVLPEDVGATSTFIERPEYCEAITIKWKDYLRKYSNTIIRQMLENEERYQDTHFVFYHAQNQENRIVVELLRSLYAWEFKKQLRSDFEFLRLWSEGSDYKDVNSYLDSFGVPISGFNDHRSEVRAVLLAVNPALFGNFELGGECTFKYFLDNYSITDVVRTTLENICKKYDLNESFIQDLLGINENYKSKTGDIVQIFIPKDLVDDYAYLCRAGGHPQGTELLDKNSKPIKKDNKGSSLYDDTRMRYTKCHTILAMLQNDKDAIRDAKNIQLRLFFSKKGPLLNPDLGAKIFRFTTLSSEQLRNYKALVKNLAKKMLPEKAELATTSYEEFTAKQKALGAEQQSVVEEAIKRLINMDIFMAMEMPNAITLIEELVARGADINGKNKYGETALMYAVNHNKLDVIKWLLQMGVDKEVRSSRGRTVLFDAVARNNVESVNMLLQAGANKNVRDDQGGTVLFQAIASGNIEIMDILLQAGVNKNVRDNQGRTSLEYAIQDDNLEAIKLLSQLSTDLKVRDNTDQTQLMRALEYAIKLGRLKAVKVLLQSGIDLDMRDNTGRTPLMYAVESRRLEEVEFLVQQGADLAVQDNDNRTALEIAQKDNRQGIAEYLKRQRKQLSSNIFTVIDHPKAIVWLSRFPKDLIIVPVRDKDDKTPLMYAVEKGKLDAVRFLVEAGVDFAAKNKNGKTAWDIAKDKGHIEIAAYLQQKYRERQPGYKKVLKKIKSKL